MSSYQISVGQTDATPIVNRRKILLVDDSKTLLAVLRVYLMGNDYEFYDAPDGNAGLERAFALKPALVVSDVKMPGITGIELTRALRCTRALRRTPIILMSGSWTAQLKNEALQAGANLCLTKPVSPKEFGAQVSRFL